MSALSDQLIELIDRLWARSTVVFGHAQIPRMPEQLCAVYLHELSRTSDIANRVAAGQIGRNLIDRAELDDDKFWATPLGRVLAWHVGYPYERCPVALIGAIIDTSRQYGWRKASEMEISRDERGRRYVPSHEVHRLARGRMRTPPPL